MGDIYRVDDVIDKTLWAIQTVPVYSTYPPQFWDGNTNLASYKIGFVKPGNPIGKVWSYVAADPTKGRKNLWWSFRDSDPYNPKLYFVEHVSGAFDIGALRDQGVISIEERIEEQKEAEDLANNPWYVNVINKVGKPILITALVIGLGSAVIKGALSRRQSA